MRYLLALLVFLILVATSASLVYAFESLMAPPEIKPVDTTPTDAVKLALSALGLSKPDWQTMVISASQEADLPFTVLWNTWARLEDWPKWSQMVISARWLGPSQWVLGSSFEQVVDLGPPRKREIRTEIVSELTPGRSARWCDDRAGIRTCQIWLFEPLVNGGTRVTLTEIEYGGPVSALKPAVSGTWQNKFDGSVKGLIARAREQVKR